MDHQWHWINMTALHQVLIASGISTPAKVTFLAQNYSTGATTQYAIIVNCGAGGDIVAVIFGGAYGISLTISSVTVGGQSATQRVYAQRSGLANVGIFTATGVPSGNQSVVITWNNNVTDCAVAVYSIRDYASLNPQSTAMDITSNNGSSATLNVPSGGAVIGGIIGFLSSPGATSWTTLTEDYDQEPNVDVSYSGASASEMSANASYNGGATMSGGATECTGAWAVWR
jgi:hypothetical protein